MTLKVIHEPEPPEYEKYPRPRERASKYRQGTVVEDERGIRWEVYWDEQDHQLEWQRAKSGAIPEIAPLTREDLIEKLRAIPRGASISYTPEAYALIFGTQPQVDEPRDLKVADATEAGSSPAPSRVDEWAARDPQADREVPR